MPPGSAPDTASVSPASAFFSVMVAEAISVLSDIGVADKRIPVARLRPVGRSR